MSLRRPQLTVCIADQLNLLAAVVKTRSRAGLTDANIVLEVIIKRFFNALHGWDLVNLNSARANYPAVDLADHSKRIAVQVTNQNSSRKIVAVTAKLMTHKLWADFDRIIVFFLLPKKPTIPKQLSQPLNGQTIETWDIADILKQLQEVSNIEVLAKTAAILEEEVTRISPLDTPAPQYSVGDPSRTALQIWMEKLEYLQVQEALCVDSDMKFRLKHLIREAQEKIRELQQRS